MTTILKLYSPSNFQVHSTVSLAVVTMLYMIFRSLLILYLTVYSL